MTSGRLSEKDGTPATASLDCPAVLFNEIERRFCSILLHKFGSLSTLRNQLVDCIHAVTWPFWKLGPRSGEDGAVRFAVGGGRGRGNNARPSDFTSSPAAAILFLACAGEEL